MSGTFALLRNWPISGREGAQMSWSDDILGETPVPARSEDPRASDEHAPVSEILRELSAAAPPDRFPLDWLLDRLRLRSFAVVILMLAVIAMAPGISIIAGALMIILGVQMVAGRSSPAFPRRVGAYAVPTVYLTGSIERVVPILTQIERVIRPRWPLPQVAAKRFVGLLVVLLSMTLVFSPIPLSNVAPAFVIALIAMAYLEEDGLFLTIALAVGSTMMLIAGIVAWQAVLGVQSITGIK
jgi:hypothetical protein